MKIPRPDHDTEISMQSTPSMKGHNANYSEVSPNPSYSIYKAPPHLSNPTIMKYSCTESALQMHNTSQQQYTTKMSLPKLMAVAKVLTPNQIDLVKSIGFQHLLDFKSKSIPKDIVLWLVTHFNVHTRTVVLPNGYSFTISPFLIHQVLGTPIGGLSLPTLSSDDSNKLALEGMKFTGKYPTINELKQMISPGLDGDNFKKVFTLFVVTSLMCPSSSEFVSPEFLPVIQNVDSIISFDWSSIVLDKLVQSICKFQQACISSTTPALGGCIYAIMIIYLDLLDTTEIDLPDYLPWIS